MRCSLKGHVQRKSSLTDPSYMQIYAGSRERLSVQLVSDFTFWQAILRCQYTFLQMYQF